MKPRTLRAAQTVAGTLGYPSKMPGTSYGLPAQSCKLGSILAKVQGTTCSGCYALDRGNYRFRDVKKAQATRLAAIEHQDWVEAMVYMLEHTHMKRDLPPYHRWHDSGDLQSVEHLARICDVCRLTPWLRHWLPTRESGMLRDYVRQGGVVPENLVIRLGATKIDGTAPRSWPVTSTVASHGNEPDGWVCPSRQQGNKCGDCRACWNPTVVNVCYPQH